MEFIDQPLLEVLPDDRCAASDADIHSIGGFAGSLKGRMNPVRNKMKGCSPLHHQICPRMIGKHKNEKYILPVTDSAKNDIAQYLIKHTIKYAEGVLYRMVSNDIATVMKQAYDMIVFFSPFSVQTLFDHFPAFKQNGTMIGAFGPTTSKAVEESGLTLDIKAPAPNTPSMVSALELFLAKNKKN